MEINVERGFNRLFLVLTGLWVVWCLLVYPLWRQQRAETAFHAEMADCYQHELGKGPDFRDCLQYAEVISGVDSWSLKSYFERESWFLALFVVMVPLVAYGLCRGIGALSMWVRRGFVR